MWKKARSKSAQKESKFEKGWAQMEHGPKLWKKGFNLLLQPERKKKKTAEAKSTGRKTAPVVEPKRNL